MVGTYSLCEEDHRIVRAIKDNAVVASLSYEHQFWDAEQKTVQTLSPQPPCLLMDKKRQIYYLFLSYTKPIQLLSRKNNARSAFQRLQDDTQSRI